MKKTLSIKIAALLIAVVVAVSAPLTSKGDVLFEKGETHRVETMVTIPIGDEEGQLSIGPSTIGDPGSEPEPDAGPGCYDITENGDIFVVDTYNKPAPIVHYSSNGEYIRTIPAELFTDSENGVSMVIANGDKLYVDGYTWETSEHYLYEYDPETEEAVRYEIPGDYTHSLLSIGDYILEGVSCADTEDCWAFNTKTHTFTPVDDFVSKVYDEGKNTFTIKLFENEFTFKIGSVLQESMDSWYGYGTINAFFSCVGIVGADDDGNLIIMYQSGGDSYRKYSPGDDNIVAYANEKYKEYVFDLGNLFIVHNGELVRSRCDGTTYKLQRVTFNEEYFTAHPFDLNLDDTENTGDAALLLQNCLGTVEFDPALKCKADINKDAYVNTGDVAAMLMELVKK